MKEFEIGKIYVDEIVDAYHRTQVYNYYKLLECNYEEGTALIRFVGYENRFINGVNQYPYEIVKLDGNTYRGRINTNGTSIIVDDPCYSPEIYARYPADDIAQDALNLNI